MLSESLIKYYRQRASEYEGIYLKPERQIHLAALKVYLRHQLEGHHVLEAACGTGYWTEILAKACKSILAFDISEEMLALAMTKPVQGHCVHFRRADAFNPVGIPPGLSAGFAGFWWSHIPLSRLHSFLQAFHSRLRPGAPVCFIDNLYVDKSSTPISHIDAEGNTYQLRRLKNGAEHLVLKNFPDESFLQSTVQRWASWITFRTFRYYWCLAYTLESDSGEMRNQSSPGKVWSIPSR